MFPERVETDRLSLRRFDEHVGVRDAYELFGRDDTVVEPVRDYGLGPVDTPKDAADRLREASDAWSDAESALYAVTPAPDEGDPDAVVATAVLQPAWDQRKARLGGRSLGRFWRSGYGVERAAALTVVAFDRLDLDVVTVGHYPGDEQAGQAVEAYVDRFGGDENGVMRDWILDAAGDTRDFRAYSVTREQYEANRPADLGIAIRDDDRGATDG